MASCHLKDSERNGRGRKTVHFFLVAQYLEVMILGMMMNDREVVIGGEVVLLAFF